MTEEYFHLSRTLVAFLVMILALIRCGCVVMFSPFFNSEAFSSQIRILLAVAFSLIMIHPAAASAMIPERMDMQQLAVLALQEMTLGLCITFLSSLVFVAVRMTGEIAGQQIGFSMANVIDPVSNVEVPLLGFIANNIVMAMFVASKLHLVLLFIIARSFHYVPIGSLTLEITRSHPILEMSLAQVSSLTAVGVRLAVPIMFIMLLNSVVEGFSAKTMPQLNMQSLGMPLRVVVGVGILVFIFPAVCAVLVPPGWTFNLSEMPDGPVGEMLVNLSGMIMSMGAGLGAAGAAGQ